MTSGSSASIPTGTAAFDLSGMVALATAGQQGIGRAVALGLAAAGADVAVADVNPAVQDTAAEIERMGRRSLALVADLTQRGEAERVVQAVIDAFGRVDVLYNGVGGMRRKEDQSYYEVDSFDLTEDDFDRAMALTVKAALFCSIAAGRHMKQQGGGRIINTTSAFATRPGPRRLPYSVAKAGLSNLTRTLAAEWGQFGIQVNELSPYARTNPTAERMADPVIGEAMRNGIALKRFGEPEEMAGAVVFLASKAASYVNGATINVTGGEIR